MAPRTAELRPDAPAFVPNVPKVEASYCEPRQKCPEEVQRWELPSEGLFCPLCVNSRFGCGFHAPKQEDKIALELESSRWEQATYLLKMGQANSWDDYSWMNATTSAGRGKRGARPNARVRQMCQGNTEAIARAVAFVGIGGSKYGNKEPHPPDDASTDDACPEAGHSESSQTASPRSLRSISGQGDSLLSAAGKVITRPPRRARQSSRNWA